MPLSDVVRNATWEDAKATASSPSLIGPPLLELATYKKVPSNRKRTDARHGTIDQDPEFMAFLEELANPTPAKGGPEDDAEEDLKREAVTTTPLVEYLKEKKSRAKESSSKKDKHSRQESSRKGKDSQKDEESSKKKGKESKADKSAKPSKDTVKILTKKSAMEQAAEVAKNAASQITAATASQDAPKSRRAGIAAAARILQRDLGLSPGSAHRRARQDAAKAEAEAKNGATKETPVKGSERPASPEKAVESASANTDSRPGTPTTQQKAQSSSRRGRGGKNAKSKGGDDKSQQTTQTNTATNPPVILKKKANGDAAVDTAEATTTEKSSAAAKSAAASATKGSSSKSNASSQKKQPSIAPDAVRGFVKHVNTSQGITEPVLRQALEAFGTVSSLEVDKRKAFAYVDFADHDSLVKAMSATPVSVAQGSIQVLERKDKKPTAAPGSSAQGGSGGGGSEKSSNRGRRGKGGGGGGKNNSSSSANAQPATATSSGAAAG
jgi:regulator of nonsense transcripts 3